MGATSSAAQPLQPMQQPSRSFEDGVRLWLVFAGEGNGLSVAGASTGAPRRGRRVLVRAPRAVLEQGSLFLLVRREIADVVLAVSASPETLERTRQGLGRWAPHYEVRSVPVGQGRSPR